MTTAERRKRQYPRLALITTLLALVAVAWNPGWVPAHDDDDEKMGGNEGPRKGNHPGHGAERHDMKLIGFNDLQARSAYQPIVHHQGNRWIAYIGHHGGTSGSGVGAPDNNGTSVVDVTNPRRPRYLFHIKGAQGAGEAGGAQMVRACNGIDLPRANKDKVYLLRATPTNHEIYDVTVPETPTLVTTVVSGLRDSHKSWWDCKSGIAYLVSGPPGWRTSRMTQVFDLGDPAHPRFIRNFGLVGQQPGATGPVPTQLHGPIPLEGRVYFGYGTSSNGTLQIVDEKALLTATLIDPANPTPAELLAPQRGRLDTSQTVGAHTVFPIHRMPIPDFVDNTAGAVRDIVVLVNESTANECRENRQLVFMVDVTPMADGNVKPQVISNYQVSEASGNFCQRGGRFGAHSSHENMNNVYYGKIMFFAWFNAGVRAVDIRNPYDPQEIGFFIPATTSNTEERCVTTNGVQTCKVAIQTNNVDVDDRGFIYTVDRAATGLHIFALTGEARKIAGLPGDDD